MADDFEHHAVGLTSPGTRLLSPVTPSDENDLPFVTRAIVVAVTGIVQVTTTGGDTGPMYCVAGVPRAMRVTRIWSSNTTATGIEAIG